MRPIVIAAAALLGAVALPTAALARPGFVTTRLNLRAGPGLGFPAVDRIPGGAQVNVHGCLGGYRWCDVSFAGDRGWIDGDHLQLLYRGRRVLIVDYGPEIDFPIVGFSVGSYWRDHYRGRNFYGRLGYWESHYHGPGGGHERYGRGGGREHNGYGSGHAAVDHGHGHDRGTTGYGGHERGTNGIGPGERRRHGDDHGRVGTVGAGGNPGARAEHRPASGLRGPHGGHGMTRQRGPETTGAAPHGAMSNGPAVHGAATTGAAVHGATQMHGGGHDHGGGAPGGSPASAAGGTDGGPDHGH